MTQIDFKEICERWLKSIAYEQSKKTDPFYIAFVANLVAKGAVNEKDLAEYKGYYKGLSVAKEIFEKVLWYYAGENGIGKECEDWYNSMATEELYEDEAEQLLEENEE